MVGQNGHAKTPHPPVRGRGTGLNPANRFEGYSLHVLPETLEEDRRDRPCGVQRTTRVYVDASRTVLNPVDSPDLNLYWTLNPYRGCEHGCVWCYARPTHETLGFSCGLDFETRIVAKPDAPRLLRSELASPGWAGEAIAMSGVTDPYQPLEAKLRITRGCLEVMAECRQPVTVVTKSRLITRDIDLLSRLARHGAVSVAVSVTTLDPKLAAIMEPRASRPADRLRAIRELSAAGIPVLMYTAPIIPGLNDREIPSLLQAASEAGAQSAHWMMIRLPHQVKTLFLDWMRTHFPDRASRIEGLIRELHGGRLYDSRFGVRSRGRGPVAEQIASTFKVFARRHGLDKPLKRPSSSAFRRPADAAQLMLFEQPQRLSRQSA
ncbi:MAG: PA0069 family radical SAM protein [Planctomycetota bacterium]|jgi:DNA repair photolyase